jgi:site-specific DNA-methyltransferase (cytosine-N4-specific)
MTPHYQDEWLTIHAGDCRAVMAEMPADSIDCVVTSPPYWGLRDYGHADQLGLERTPEQYVANMVAVFAEVRRAGRRDAAGRCGA